MLKHLFISLFFFAAQVVLFSQSKADSLLALADKSTSDSVKVKEMNNAVWELMFSEKSRSLKIALNALSIAERTKNPHSLSDCYNTLGVYFWITSEFQKSLGYHQKALDIREKLKDMKGLVSTYNNLASTLKELGDYKQETDYYFKALKLAESNKDTLVQTKIMNNIADAFYRQEQYDKAEKYNNQSLAIRERLKDWPGVITCYINLGNVKHKIQKFAEAEAFFQKAGEILNEYGDNYLLAKYHANYGSLLKDAGRYEEAKKHIEQSIAANNAIGNTSSNLVNYSNIAAIYNQLGENKKGNEAYMNVLLLAKEIGNLQWQRQAEEGLANTFAGLKQYEDALEHRIKFEQLKDTLHNLDINQLFAETETKYKVEKKDAEIQLLAEKNKNTELQLKQRTYVAVLAGLLLLLMIGAGYIIWTRNRIKQENRIAQTKKESEEKERVRIAKDIHDELGSGLTKIKFLSEMNATAKNDGSSRTVAETAKHLVDNMRDLIWVMNPDNTKLDNLVARIREYSYDYLEEFPIELKSDFPNHVTPIDITKEVHRNVFMVVKESLQNMVKHSEATEIKITIEAHDDLKLHIEDNGKGYDVAKHYEGNGLKNMRSRITAINGTIQFRSEPNKYSRIEIAVPRSNLSNTTFIG